MSRVLRSFTIIADDYGLGLKHNSVMRELLEKGALDGVSVLVSDEIKGEESEKLRSLADQGGQQIGLHLNLTRTMPGLAFAVPVGKLLFQSITGRLDSARVREAVHAQFDIFVSAFDRLPDFVDGHQHCHCFPVVSDIVISAAKERMGSRRFWIRSPNPSHLRGILRAIRLGGPKSLIIMGLGARMRRRLQKAGIATNEDFSGIMALHTEKNVEERLRRILDEAGPGCVVMTHPGDSLDPEQIADHQPGARTREARVLKAFLGDVD